jgi:hypothetical protein
MPIPDAQKRDALMSADDFTRELNQLQDTRDAGQRTLNAARKLLSAVQGIINRLRP